MKINQHILFSQSLLNRNTPYSLLHYLFCNPSLCILRPANQSERSRRLLSCLIKDGAFNNSARQCTSLLKASTFSVRLRVPYMLAYSKLLPCVSYISMQQKLPPSGFPFIIMQRGRANKKYHCLYKLFIHTLANLCDLTAITHYLSREVVRLHLNISRRLWHIYSIYIYLGVTVHLCTFLTKAISGN